MVKKEEFEGEESFRCEVCGFHYKEKEMAEECEKHCLENDSCDSEIAMNALENKGRRER